MMCFMRSSTSSAVDCPAAAPTRESIFPRALHRACLILGGVAELATHLEATEIAVRAWLEALEQPPESAFLAAVDVILLHAESTSGRAS
jgi:hypothetical protein